MNVDDLDQQNPTHILVTTHECSYDLPSAMNMAFSAIGGSYPSVKIASKEEPTSSIPFDSVGVMEESNIRTETEPLGGSLFAYKLPRIKRKPKIRNSASSSWLESNKKRNITYASNSEDEVADNGHMSSVISLPIVKECRSNPNVDLQGIQLIYFL